MTKRQTKNNFQIVTKQTHLINNDYPPFPRPKTTAAFKQTEQVDNYNYTKVVLKGRKQCPNLSDSMEEQI